MNSMTGFGRAEIRRKEYRLQVELSSVNSRFLECIFRMPRVLAGAESKVKEIVSRNIARGKLTITVNLEESAAAMGAAGIDPEIAEAYYRQLKRVKKKLNLPGQVELGHIVARPELLVNPGRGLDEERLWPDLKKLMDAALRELKQMRSAEGRNLKRDMKTRLRGSLKFVDSIEKQAPKNVAAYKARLQKRINELAQGVAVDQQRLAEEVTIYADRADVSEECTRLRSHIDQYSLALREDGEVGKRLNFILQEMGREANTIGSKSVNARTTNYAIALKEEIEKLREQAQNIE
jgi:uncharacterized protein (TIGR00255 family)